MAIEYYSSIKLNQNELQFPVVHKVGTAPSSPAAVAGQLYYNSSSNTLNFYNGSAWISVGGDITGVTAGAGLSGGGTTGDVTLAVDISEFSDVTPANGDKLLTLDSDGDTEQLTTLAALATLNAGTGLSASNAVLSVDASQTQITAIGTITTGTWNGSVIASAYLDADTAHLSGAQTFTGAKTFSGGTTIINSLELGATDHVMEDGGNILDENDNHIIGSGSGIVTVGGNTKIGGTLTVPSDIIHDGDTNNKIAFGTDTQSFETGGIARVNISDSGLQIGSGARVTTIENNDSLGTSDTKLATQGNIKAYVDGQTYDDVSNANLLSALAALESSGGAADENIVIGADSGDTIVITGNLQVSGTTTTVNSTTVDLNDHNITLDSGNSTSAVVDGAGITLSGGTGDDATFTYNASATAFEFKLGTSYESIKVDAVIANSLDIETDVDINGTLETDALTINGTAIVAQATASAVGGVELATAAEVITGTDAARVVTADTLSAKSVVADIVVSSLLDANIVTITHNLGTADIMVQVYDKTTEANIMCDIARTTDDFSTASTSVVSIDFGTAPPNDCRVLITSLAGATASGTVAYT